MNIRKLLAAFGVAAIISGASATLVAAPHAYPEPMDARSEREADLYEQGTDAVDEGDWNDALRAFKKVAEMNGTRADGAVYWMAYSLNRLGRRSEALSTIEALKKAYPSSQWLDDARALDLEVRQGSGQRVGPDQVDDIELKMIAIQSLMHTDPEKAFPLLEKIVKGPSHRKVKEQALFVLSQSSSPKAQTLLASIARGSADPDLQEDAVQYLGVAGGERNRQLLADIYSSVSSEDVKEQILQAFMVAGDKQRILNAAKGEKNTDLRETAIQLLGVMGARADLHAMYATETSRDLRENIIQALFVSGDAEKLADLAKTEKDVELRSEAIRSLGLIGKNTAPLLLSLYASEPSQEVKEAVIEGFFVQGNARALIDLSKKEKDRELRKDIVEKLSLMQDDEAVAYMLQILEEN